MSLHSSRVIEAVLTGLAAALGSRATVAEEEKRPQDIGDGLVLVRRGEVGEPTVFLSPRAYAYDHAIGLEVVAPTREEVDDLLLLIDQWIETHRDLDGLTEWLEATAPETDVAEQFGTETYPYALLDLVASYTTPSPLS